MPEPKINSVIIDLTAAQGALVRATKYLQASPDIEGQKALEELINANRFLANVLKIVVIDPGNSTTPVISTTLLREVLVSHLRHGVLDSNSFPNSTKETSDVIYFAAGIMIQLYQSRGDNLYAQFHLTDLKAAKRLTTGDKKANVISESRLLREVGLIEYVEAGQVGKGYQLANKAHELYLQAKTASPTIPAPQPLDITNASRMELLDNLKRPISDLRLCPTASAICCRAPLVVIRDGLPYQIKLGITSIGEMVQLNGGDFRTISNCGKKTLADIISKLGEIGLKLGSELSDAELVHIDVERITLDDSVHKSGYVPQLKDGTHAIARGAKDIINYRIDSLAGLKQDHIDRFTNIIIKESTTERPLTTVGELVQIKTNRGLHSLPIYLDSILQHLLPKGLCIEMCISDTLLEELGIPPVEFVRYKYARIVSP